MSDSDLEIGGGAQDLSLERVDVEPRGLGLAQLLGRHPIWSTSPTSVRAALAESGTIQDYGVGQVAVVAGQPAQRVLLLLEGALRLYTPPSAGRDALTVRVLLAPALLGDAEAISGALHPATAEAMLPCRVASFPAAPYLRALKSAPDACLLQFHDLAQRALKSEQLGRVSHEGSAADRIVALILVYLDQFGVPTPTGTLIDRHLPQEELAEQSGSRRRTVVRTLRRLYDGGFLRRSGRKLVVPDPERLRRALGGEDLPLAHRTGERPALNNTTPLRRRA